MFDGLVRAAAGDVLLRLHVARVMLEHERCVRRLRLLGTEDRGQDLILDLDELFGLLQRLAVTRADEGDGIAEVLRHLPDGDHRGLVLLDMADVQLAGHILRCQHTHNARQRFGRALVDREHTGARILAAHGAAVAHAVNIYVIGILSVALHLFGNVDAVHTLADLIAAGAGCRDLPLAQDLCRQQDAVNDLYIACAAADIIADGKGRFFARRIGISVQKSFGRDHHARDAEAALDCARLTESVGIGFLFKIGKPFDRNDRLAFKLVRLRNTGFSGLTVDQNMAGTARTLAASVLDGQKMQLVAQEADKLLVFLRRYRRSVDNKSSLLISELSTSFYSKMTEISMG